MLTSVLDYFGLSSAPQHIPQHKKNQILVDGYIRQAYASSVRNFSSYGSENMPPQTTFSFVCPQKPPKVLNDLVLIFLGTQSLQLQHQHTYHRPHTKLLVMLGAAIVSIIIGLQEEGQQEPKTPAIMYKVRNQWEALHNTALNENNSPSQLDNFIQCSCPTVSFLDIWSYFLEKQPPNCEVDTKALNEYQIKSKQKNYRLAQKVWQSLPADSHESINMACDDNAKQMQLVVASILDKDLDKNNPDQNFKLKDVAWKQWKEAIDISSKYRYWV